MRRVRDPMKEIQLGSDGIVIEDQGRSGTFLPQVATETGWSLEEFLGHCSRDKAGLGWEGWKNPRARIYSYTVTIIQDEKTHRGNR
jgi:AMMECR1 domain-containing protein